MQKRMVKEIGTADYSYNLRSFNFIIVGNVFLHKLKNSFYLIILVNYSSIFI